MSSLLPWLLLHGSWDWSAILCCSPMPLRLKLTHELQVDNALLSHPRVQEAVAFAAPDDMYGEHVAAAVVLDRVPSNAAATIADIKEQIAKPIAAFKVRQPPARSCPGKGFKLSSQLNLNPLVQGH